MDEEEGLESAGKLVLDSWLDRREGPGKGNFRTT
jgi:hypothetical protein